MRRADQLAVHIGLPGAQGLSLLKEALDRIAEDARRHDGTSEVLLIGRYRHLKPQNIGALKKQYPGLRFSWMTVQLEGARGRLRGGARPVLRQTRVSLRDYRRSVAGPGAARARSPSECRGATPALRRHHPRETAGLPACRRRSTVNVRERTDRRRVRCCRLWPVAGR